MDRLKEIVTDNDGFTLIELMIVVAIILILYVVSVPSMQRRSSSQQADRQGMAEEVDSNRITPAMLRQQRQETAMVLRAVQDELRDEIR